MQKNPLATVGLVFALLILALFSACRAQEAAPATPTGLPPTVTATAPPPTPTPTATLSPAEPVQGGDDLLLNSDLEGAVAAYQRAIDIDPDYAPAYVGLSQAYYWLGDRDSEALSQAEIATELDPKNTDAWVALSRAQIVEDQAEAALESAQKAVALDPANAIVQAALSDAYSSNYQFDQAQEAIAQAYALDPQSARVLASLGTYHYHTADFVRAQAAYQAAADLEPNFIGWKTRLGALLLTRSRYDQAAEVLETALALYPDHIPTLLKQASIETSKRQYAQAESILQKVAGLGFDGPGLKLAWTQYYAAQEDYDLAVEQVQAAMAQEPQDWGSMTTLGNIYIYQSECDLARNQFQELGTQFPADPAARIGRGWAEICAGDPSKALTHFRDAIKINPYDSEAYQGLGIAYLYQNRVEETKDAYLQALSLSPSPASVHLLLGSWAWVQDRMDEAKQEYRIALEQDPYLMDAYLYLGDLLLSNDQTDAALEMVESALEIDPEHLDIKRFKAIILYHQGETGLAEPILDEVLADDPEDGLAHHYLGLVYRDQEKYSQAKKEIETYLRLEGQYLGENESMFLNYLVKNLSVGYTVSEEKAIADMDEFYPQIMDKPPRLEIKTDEEGERTLIVTVPITTAEIENEDAMYKMGMVLSMSAFFVPRITPPISNGLIAQFQISNKTNFTAEMSLSDLKDFSDGLTPSEALFEVVEISMVSESALPSPLSQVKRNVSELRELDSQSQVAVEKISPQDLNTHLTESIDEQVRASFEKDEAYLELIGVISPTLDLEETWIDLYNEQVIGFYVPGEDTLYLVEQEKPSSLDDITVAHEYTHALQDQQFDLDALHEQEVNDDQRLAIDALIEGDATLVTSMYSNQYISVMDQLDAASRVSGMAEDDEPASQFLMDLAVFPYAGGVEFVSALHQRGGWESVNLAYEDLPKSTEQILHPERYWEADNPKIVSLPDLAAAFPEGWSEADEDVQGEWIIRLSLAEHIGPIAAEAAADGWGGDRYRLMENQAADQYLLVMQTDWDDQEAADEFWSIYQASLQHRPAYTEVIQSMIDPPQHHLWSSDSGFIFAAQQDTTVTIIIGPTEEIVTALAALFNSP